MLIKSFSKIQIADLPSFAHHGLQVCMCVAIMHAYITGKQKEKCIRHQRERKRGETDEKGRENRECRFRVHFSISMKILLQNPVPCTMHLNQGK